MRETALLNAIRLEAVKIGCILHRNNVGMLEDKRGQKVRYGLAVGSGDLIGWTTIGGKAIFTSVEVKRPTKKPTMDQVAWMQAVQRAGGIACVASTIADVQFAVWEYARRQA